MVDLLIIPTKLIDNVIQLLEKPKVVMFFVRDEHVAEVLDNHQGPGKQELRYPKGDQKNN